MNDETRDLLATRALGSLTPAETARLDEDRARDPALAAEYDEYRMTVAMLESALARRSAPPDLFKGVLARIEAERTPLAKPRSPRKQRRFTWRPRSLVPAFAIGAAAAVLVIAIALTTSGGLGTENAYAAVQGTPDYAAVHGQARLYGTTGDNGKLVLDLADVPPAAAGHHYEVWVLRDTPGKAMEAVGVFRPTRTKVRLELRLPGPGTYQAVDVSVEPDGGSAAHSDQSLAGGRFESPSA